MGLLLAGIFGSLQLAQAQITPPKLPYIDIHIHAGIKPFNSLGKDRYNHWERIEHSCTSNYSKFFVKNADELPRRSQSNFAAMVGGNVRLGFLSLTPMEVNMLKPRLLNLNKRGVATFNCISGVNTSLWRLKQKDRDYWADLSANLRFVLGDEAKPYALDGRTLSYHFIRNRTDLETVLSDPDRMGVLLNIEGGHALGHSYAIDRRQTDRPDYAAMVLLNADRLKGVAPLDPFSDYRLDVPVISIGLCHFFWNGLAGHARTFTGTQEFIFGKQRKADQGFTDLGRQIVARLLDRQRGRRILIDIKHMSLRSRREYYARLDSAMAVGDTIPIISSHSTISSLSWDDPKYSRRKDNFRKNKRSTLNEWTISLCREDLRKIAETGGLAGIMLDKYRLMGRKTKRLHRQTVAGSRQRHQLMTDLILANLFMAAAHIGDARAWDVLCIGSDYDGMIIPPDNYQTAEDWPQLADDLTNFLHYPHALFDLFSAEDIERLMFGLSPEEIVRRVLSENGISFLRRHLPEE